MIVKVFFWELCNSGIKVDKTENSKGNLSNFENKIN